MGGGYQPLLSADPEWVSGQKRLVFSPHVHRGQL